MNEVWKTIDGFEGQYEVSNMGRVRSLNYHRTGKTRVLKAGKGSGGYYMVVLRKDGKPKSINVHRLVGKAFVDGFFEGAVINHKDHNLENNIAENLEWTTQADNTSREKSFSPEISKKLYSKRVLQYTKQGDFVKEWPSMIEVEHQTGFARSHIRECCNGERKSAYGFVWKYKT